MLVSKLRLPNPKFEEAVNAGRSTWKINQYIYNFEMLPDDSMLIPRGMRPELISLTERFKVPYSINDQRSNHEFISLDASQIKYRATQGSAIISLIGAEEGVLVAPPGSGKTVMGISLLAIFGQPMLWLTHTRPLARQALNRVRTFYPELDDDAVGLLGDKSWKFGRVFTVGIVQTLIRKTIEEIAEISDRFGIVILDEAHHCPAKTFTDVVKQFNPRYLYGLTATPYRRDKLENLMFQTMGPETARIDITDVENEGTVIVPKLRYRTIDGRRIDDNNFARIITSLIKNDRRNDIIISDVLREAVLGHYCILLSDRKEHCEILYKSIKEIWPKTGIATGDYSKKKIDEVISSLSSGEVTVLVATPSLLGEGFDFKYLSRAFFALPFRAEAKAEQLVGRVSRSAPGKADAIVYDYVDINAGVLYSQFYSKSKSCRYRVYERLGMMIEPY